MLVRIPTLNTNSTDFDYLFRLWAQLNNECFLDVTFDFSHCGFLQPNAVAFLGGLARLVEHNFGSVTFNWRSLRSDVERNLRRSGFMQCFGEPGGDWRGNTIPFRHDSCTDSSEVHDEIIAYLTDEWLGRGWVNVSARLRDAIAGRVWEIYTNAFEHSRSDIGVFSCGQYFPRIGRLKLAVIDFGVGIPTNVRDFWSDRTINSASALKWAFKQGTTTSPIEGVTRGLGLDILRDFVTVNRGQLEVFSGDGYAVINDRNETYSTRECGFSGTMINITIQCDERYYFLSSEKSDEEELVF